MDPDGMASGTGQGRERRHQVGESSRGSEKPRCAAGKSIDLEPAPFGRGTEPNAEETNVLPNQTSEADEET